MTRFHEALRAIVASSVASGALACGGGVDRTGLELAACVEGGEPLVGVVPVTPADYVEIRAEAGGPLDDPGQRRSRGARCATAADAPKCEADYAAVRFLETDGRLFRQSVDTAPREIVVVTDASGVRVLRTPDEVKAWLGPIDAPADAIARVELEGYTVACGDVERGAVGASGGGFRVLATRITSSCDPVDTTEYLLEVSRDGAVRVAEEALVESESGVCIGRRPEGLAPSRRGRARGPSGAGGAGGAGAPSSEDRAAAWLAEVARLEAASVASFERLAAELEAFGAPSELVARARAAAADELRHAALVGALAERRGACVEAPAIAPFRPRSLEPFALENAVEGCVLETFGALVGMAQAELAADFDVRQVMRSVAADEARHGELAWAVHAWAVHRLAPDAGARVRVARDAALRALVAAAADAEPSLDGGAARALGVLRGASRRVLAERFARAASGLARAA